MSLLLGNVIILVNRVFRNYKGTSLFALLLLGLCLSLTIPLYADGSNSIILKDSEEWYTLSNTYVKGVVADDIDQDGTTEIVTVGRYETGDQLYGEWIRHGQIKIWNWNGTALNLEHTENWTATYWRSIRKVAIGDVDDDGVKEIVTVGYLFETTPVWAYKGELAIWNWNETRLELEHVETWYYTPTNQGVEAYDVWIGDIDNDETNEMITCGWYWNPPVGYEAQLRIWNWNGTDIMLEHSEEWEEAVQIIPVSLFAKDVDQDGVVEIITGGFKRNGSDYKSQVRIWNWNGTTLTLEHNEEWGEFTSTNSSTVNSVFAKDLNNDGMTEIITTGWKAPHQAQLRIWNWNGTVFTLKHSEEWNYTTGVAVNRVYADDVNADGITELVSVGHMNNNTYYQGQLRTWQWNGTSLTLINDEEWGTQDIRCVNVFVSDVDGDYLKEIITVGYVNDTTRWNGQLRICSFPDLIPPSIGHPIREPSGDVEPLQEVKISVNITDFGVGVKNATLYYTITNGTSWEPPRLMAYNSTTGYYETTIPGQPAGTWVKYKITAYDNAGNPYTEDNSGEYFVYTVIPEFQILLILIFIIATLTAIILTKTRKQLHPHFS